MRIDDELLDAIIIDWQFRYINTVRKERYETIGCKGYPTEMDLEFDMGIIRSLAQTIDLDQLWESVNRQKFQADEFNDVTATYMVTLFLREMGAGYRCYETVATDTPLKTLINVHLQMLAEKELSCTWALESV